MGRFLNPDNGAFSEAVNSEIYIDKTRLLEYTNQVINTTSKFICNSRPRRFGKSMTADMLSAYYSRGCDSKELFKNYEISTVSSYEKNLNKDVYKRQAHTLNNTVVAPPRMLIAFLENNLNEDGSVNIPKALQPYMGGIEKIVPKHE